MKTRVRGKIHGKTIQVDADLGLPEGQDVEVRVRVVANSTDKPGEGFLRTEGALADDEEWDAIMEEIYRSRKLERRSTKEPPGPPPGWEPERPSRTAGLLADSWTEEDDRILDEIERDRKRDSR